MNREKLMNFISTDCLIGRTSKITGTEIWIFLKFLNWRDGTFVRKSFLLWQVFPYQNMTLISIFVDDFFRKSLSAKNAKS